MKAVGGRVYLVLNMGDLFEVMRDTSDENKHDGNLPENAGPLLAFFEVFSLRVVAALF
jgi:hypothetical protein